MNLGLVGKEETVKKVKDILTSRFDNLVVTTFPSADAFVRDTQVRKINFSRIIILQTAFDFRNNVVVSPEDVLRSFGSYIFEKFQGCRVVYITTNETSHALFHSLLDSTYVAVINNKSAKPSLFYNLVEWDIKQIKKELGGELKTQKIDSDDEVIEDDVVESPPKPKTQPLKPSVKDSGKKGGFWAKLGFKGGSKKTDDKSTTQGNDTQSDPVLSGETNGSELSGYFDSEDPWENPETPEPPESPLVPLSFRGGSDIGLGSGHEPTNPSPPEDEDENDHLAFPEEEDTQSDDQLWSSEPHHEEEHPSDQEGEGFTPFPEDKGEEQKWGGFFPEDQDTPSGGESPPAEWGSTEFSFPSDNPTKEWDLGDSPFQDTKPATELHQEQDYTPQNPQSRDSFEEGRHNDEDSEEEVNREESASNSNSDHDSGTSLAERKLALEELGRKLRSTQTPSLSDVGSKPSIPTISLPSVEEAFDEGFYVPDAAKVTSDIEREQEEKRKVVVEKVIVKEVKVGGKVRGANPRIIVVTGDRRSGVSTTAFNLAAASALTEKTLFVDFDLKRRGALLFGVLEQLLASEENIQRGLEGLQSVSILPNIAFPFVEGDFDCILTRYDISVSDDHLRTVCDVLLGQREYRTIVIDCPVENLDRLKTLIPYASVLFCLEDDLGSTMNSVISLSGVFSNERDTIQLYTNLRYLVTKDGSVEGHYQNMAHIVELFSLDDTTSNWGKSPVVNPTQPVSSLYKELISNIS